MESDAGNIFGGVHAYARTVLTDPETPPNKKQPKSKRTRYNFITCAVFFRKFLPHQCSAVAQFNDVSSQVNSSDKDSFDTKQFIGWSF